ncbi:MAG TPA: nucleotidyltransferase family protein [Syntrophorhabdaceae bacterium]|nr:nucleotidyltransferase family protein [Syntrophorhabdaceae bacterium]HXK70687.1 nucleotidyltransferase family protein [Caldisericia bacterium]
MKGRITDILKKHLPEIKTRFRIKNIGVFGSQIRGEANKKSDIDILVEFENGYKTFDNYMDLKFYLEELLGSKVDLVLKDALKEELKPHILSEVVYA